MSQFENMIRQLIDLQGLSWNWHYYFIIIQGFIPYFQ